MILISGCFFAVAFFLSARIVHGTFSKKMKMTESDWIFRLQTGLSREFLFVDFKQLKKSCRVLPYLGALISLYIWSAWPLILGIGLMWGLPLVFLRFMQKRRRVRFEKQFGRALPQIASSLRAGHTLDRALESMARVEPNPLAQEMELVLKEIRMGNSLDQALDSLLRRFPSRDLEMLVRATAISRRVGSSLAQVFEKVAELVITRSKLRDRLSTLTAQGRIQAWVAVVMPLLLLITLNFMAPEYLEPLWFTQTGHLALGASAVMITIGGIWIHKISRTELLR